MGKRKVLNDVVSKAKDEEKSESFKEVKEEKKSEPFKEVKEEKASPEKSSNQGLKDSARQLKDEVVKLMPQSSGLMENKELMDKVISLCDAVASL